MQTHIALIANPQEVPDCWYFVEIEPRESVAWFVYGRGCQEGASHICFCRCFEFFSQEGHCHGSWRWYHGAINIELISCFCLPQGGLERLLLSKGSGTGNRTLQPVLKFFGSMLPVSSKEESHPSASNLLNRLPDHSQQHINKRIGSIDSEHPKGRRIEKEWGDRSNDKCIISMSIPKKI